MYNGQADEEYSTDSSTLQTITSPRSYGIGGGQPYSGAECFQDVKKKHKMNREQQPVKEHTFLFISIANLGSCGIRQKIPANHATLSHHENSGTPICALLKINQVQQLFSLLVPSALRTYVSFVLQFAQRCFNRLALCTYLPGILGAPEFLREIPVLSKAGAMNRDLLAPACGYRENSQACGMHQD